MKRTSRPAQQRPHRWVSTVSGDGLRESHACKLCGLVVETLSGVRPGGRSTQRFMHGRRMEVRQNLPACSGQRGVGVDDVYRRDSPDVKRKRARCVSRLGRSWVCGHLGVIPDAPLSEGQRAMLDELHLALTFADVGDIAVLGTVRARLRALYLVELDQRALAGFGEMRGCVQEGR